MRWAVTLKNGNVIKEGVMKFTEIQKRDIKSVCMEDTTSESLALFNSELGTIQIPNIDVTKLGNIVDEQKFICTLDKETGSLVLLNSSLKNLNEVICPSSCKFKFEINSTGKMNVNGKELVIGLFHKNNLYTFDVKEVESLTQFRDAYTDITVSNKQVKTLRIDRISSHNLAFTNSYVVDEVTLKVRCQISYNILEGIVLMKYQLMADKSLQTSIYYKYGDVEKRIPVYLTDNSPMETKKSLELLR